ncbi:MAG: hypothetical protein QNJ72_27940 [Pleurocapsa sp. MO_226.B13]|nr:hypothetical protein [Pleurocapsa sp. MO_226.B13]
MVQALVGQQPGETPGLRLVNVLRKLHERDSTSRNGSQGFEIKRSLKGGIQFRPQTSSKHEPHKFGVSRAQNYTRSTRG